MVSCSHTGYGTYGGGKERRPFLVRARAKPKLPALESVTTNDETPLAEGVQVREIIPTARWVGTTSCFEVSPEVVLDFGMAVTVRRARNACRSDTCRSHTLTF